MTNEDLKLEISPNQEKDLVILSMYRLIWSWKDFHIIFGYAEKKARAMLKYVKENSPARGLGKGRVWRDDVYRVYGKPEFINKGE